MLEIIYYLMPTIVDIIIILTCIIVSKYLIYKTIDSLLSNNELARKIKLPVFISLLLFAFFVPQLFIKDNLYNIEDKEFNDFNGFLHYPSMYNKTTIISLLKALKMNPGKIKHIDMITGYTTDYVSINNQSNIQNASIIRLFYSDDRTQCLSESKYKHYFGGNVSYKVHFETLANTPDGLCLSEKEIAYTDASKYEYAPPITKGSHNEEVFYFFPFKRTITSTFPVIAMTNRENHALENIHNEKNIMEYVSVGSKFGTFQIYFGKHIRPSDEILIGEFLKKVKN
ncbi:hypothetical protein ACFLR3_04075 [Campylobacterota bacterium]